MGVSTRGIRLPKLGRIIRLLSLLLLMHGAVALAQDCHYSTWQWDVAARKAVGFKNVARSFESLGDLDRDARSGCSVCIEDQALIRIDGIEPFRICKRYAERVRGVLAELLSDGVPIKSVVGYRVGKSRGAVDALGRRTQFSNHSFGVAMDINSQSNGLYSNCLAFNEHCELLRGGHWRPGRDPYSLTPNGEVVTKMKSIGFKWGGEIEGRQKDFMHFSLTGY